MASQLRWTSKSVDLLGGVSRGRSAEGAKGMRRGAGEWETATYYAGKRRILRPAASTAHCAMEGYGSLMAASGGASRGLAVVR